MAPARSLGHGGSIRLGGLVSSSDKVDRTTNIHVSCRGPSASWGKRNNNNKPTLEDFLGFELEPTQHARPCQIYSINQVGVCGSSRNLTRIKKFLPNRHRSNSKRSAHPKQFHSFRYLVPRMLIMSISRVVVAKPVRTSQSGRPRAAW